MDESVKKKINKPAMITGLIAVLAIFVIVLAVSPLKQETPTGNAILGIGTSSTPPNVNANSCTADSTCEMNSAQITGLTKVSQEIQTASSFMMYWQFPFTNNNTDKKWFLVNDYSIGTQRAAVSLRARTPLNSSLPGNQNAWIALASQSNQIGSSSSIMLVADKTQISSPEVEVQVLAGDGIAYVCATEYGVLFRSDVPCTEAASPSDGPSCGGACLEGGMAGLEHCDELPEPQQESCDNNVNCAFRSCWAACKGNAYYCSGGAD